MKRLSYWIVLALFCTSLGCAGAPLTPKSVPLGDYDMTFVKSRKPVAVINAQEIKRTEIEVKDSGTVKADLNSWCEQSIDLIGQWLKYNSIPIDRNAAKKLYVSILNARSERPGSYSLELQIKTVDGLVKTFSTEATAYGSERAVGYAITWGVAKMIRDADILYYMEQ